MSFFENRYRIVEKDGGFYASERGWFLPWWTDSSYGHDTFAIAFAALRDLRRDRAQQKVRKIHPVCFNTPALQDVPPGGFSTWVGYTYHQTTRISELNENKNSEK
jgi:hypothetical protein